MKRIYLLLIMTLVSGVAHSYQAPEPDFIPLHLRDTTVSDYVNRIFTNDFKRWQDPPEVYELKSVTYSLKVKSNELIITHFYLTGKGWSENKSESFQFITANVSGSKHILFQSGLFMPECGGASWDINDFSFTETSLDGAYSLSAKRTLHGCFDTEEYETVYKATYDINMNILEEVSQHMMRKP